MMTYEKLKEKLEKEPESYLVPESRVDVLNTFLTVLVCEKLEALTEELKALRESLPKSPQLDVVEKGKPGRKPKTVEPVETKGE